MVHDVLNLLPTPLMLALAAVAVIAESALLFGLVLPGTTMLLALGLATRLGDVPLAAAFPVAIGAAVLGGQLSYLRGRHHRGALTGVLKRLHKAVERAEHMIARHGVWSIAVAQWIGGLRTFAPRLAGRAHVPYRTFWLTQIPVAALWAAVFVSLGHFAGLAMQQRIGTLATVAGIVAVAAGLVFYAVRRRTPRSEPEPVPAAAPGPAPVLIPAPAPAGGAAPQPVPVPAAQSAPSTDHLQVLPGTWPTALWMCCHR